MQEIRCLLCACCFLLVSCGGLTQTAGPPLRDIAPGVRGVIEVPQDFRRHPRVVLLHGSAGWQPVYAAFAGD